MKLQPLYKLLFIAIVTVFASCVDTLDKIGFTIQPENDRVSVGTDTLYVSSRTIQVDSVFSRTKYPILGEYIDPVFGSIRSEYVGEFYYPESQAFKDDAIIDSVRLTVSYSSIIGDSLAPMRLAVYKVIGELPKNHDYTNFDPRKKADMSAPLGTQMFTGRNNTYRTEIYYSGNTTQEVRIYEIYTKLPTSIGQSFLDEYKKPDHGALKNTDTFRKFFPGLYITTNFGNSTILNVNLTSLNIFYNYIDPKGSSQKTDTIRTSEFRLNITPEVTQINHIQNNNNRLLAPNDKGTFVKSPAGVNTEITFPISEIYSKLTNRSLNQARFIVYALPEANQDEKVKLSPPDHLLLVNKDSLKGFFENRRLHDNVTSFYASFNSETYSYNFGNIAAMINYYKRQKNEAFDLTYYLVPVDITFTTTGASYYSQGASTPTAIYNQMKPSAVMLENKPEKLKLDIIYSSF
ncbi:MAG: hypothetical protein BWZ00_01134 [Bacteroidetes bacterium ADurb.BinA174]|nr:MAG: hypothetical protein BWZ00_01134 [Bacteroidetes bacterium ADurb.BinA174]